MHTVVASEAFELGDCGLRELADPVANGPHRQTVAIGNISWTLTVPKLKVVQRYRAAVLD